MKACNQWAWSLMEKRNEGSTNEAKWKGERDEGGEAAKVRMVRERTAERKARRREWSGRQRERERERERGRKKKQRMCVAGARYPSEIERLQKRREGEKEQCVAYRSVDGFLRQPRRQTPHPARLTQHSTPYQD